MYAIVAQAALIFAQPLPGAPWLVFPITADENWALSASQPSPLDQVRRMAAVMPGSCSSQRCDVTQAEYFKSKSGSFPSAVKSNRT